MTADTHAMVKTVGVLAILCALTVGGMSWARQSFQTAEKAPTAILDAAAVAIEFSHRTNGTYAGTTPASVTLVSADVRSYCLEFQGFFLAGPGGVPQAGSCPR